MSSKQQDILVDILKTTSKKREKSNEVFRNIRLECEEKIRRRLNEGGKSLEFNFPIVKPGLPTYDLEGCVAYVLRHLHGRGIDASMIAPRIMHVSWERALREAKRQNVEQVLYEHRRKKEEKAKAKRRKEEEKTLREKGPPLPPNADDPNDLFSLPSVRNLKTTANVLRHV